MRAPHTALTTRPAGPDEWQFISFDFVTLVGPRAASITTRGNGIPSPSANHRRGWAFLQLLDRWKCENPTLIVANIQETNTVTQKKGLFTRFERFFAPPPFFTIL
jgi:hypothetical protein